jgi:Family of unknown function (DUF6527)
MNARMRFRTDSPWIAAAKAKGRTFEQEYDGDVGDGWAPTPEARAIWDATPLPEPGDTWRVRWYGSDAMAGYDICCPKCREIHGWTTATNCGSRRALPEWEYTDPTTGVKSMKPGGFTCDHSGVGSCWNWQGSAEDNAMTASPSLWCQEEKGGCGWHGWLQNGEMRSC